MFDVVGQGLSLAIEDAVVLAWHLQQQGVCQSALRRYAEVLLTVMQLAPLLSRSESIEIKTCQQLVSQASLKLRIC